VAALVHKGLDRADDAIIYYIVGEGAVSAGELRALVAQTCAALSAAGVGPGRAVAVDAAPRLESCLIVLAAMLLGAPVVRLTHHFDAASFCAEREVAPAALTVSKQADWATGLTAAGHLVGLDDSNAQNFADWLADHDGASIPPAATVMPGDTALIGFTSGSTGAPKCIATSHEAVFRATEAMQSLFAFTREDVFCTVSNFSALSAFRSIITLPLLTAGRALLPSPAAATSPLAMAIECRDYGVTQLTAVPALLRSLTALQGRLGPAPLPALKTAFSGSGVLDQPSCDRFVAAFCVPAVDYYGGREFATAVYADRDGVATVSSAGGLPVNCLIRIVGGDGRQLPAGACGQVMVHSDSMMQDLPAAPFPAWQGWHNTGDLGIVDSGGRLRIVGRVRDVIKARDGTMIFPAEIEGALMTIEGVSEAAVFGHSAADGSEHVIAAVTLAEPDDNFAARAAVLMLARVGQMRMPSCFIAVPDFPRVGSLKIDRAALKASLEASISHL